MRPQLFIIAINLISSNLAAMGVLKTWLYVHDLLVVADKEKNNIHCPSGNEYQVDEYTESIG